MEKSAYSHLIEGGSHTQNIEKHIGKSTVKNNFFVSEVLHPNTAHQDDNHYKKSHNPNRFVQNKLLVIFT